ncbi:MAG: TIM-barrel domain-containing protein, partial [Stellaceae bacterium]
MNDFRRGVTIEGAPVPLAIYVLTPRLVRVRLGERPENSPASYLSAGDTQASALTRATAWPARIDTGELVIEVATDPWRLSLCDRDGTTRLQVPLDTVVLGPRLRLRLEAREGQHYYGLGEGGQSLDRLGVTRRLWNHHVNHGPGAQISIPLLLSHLGYGLFFDCSADGEIAPGDSSGSIEVGFESDERGLDLYYLGGRDLRETLAAAADLLGHAPLPPRWALGFLQSTRHFESEGEIRDLAATLRAKQLPCDGLIFLSTYGDQRGWNRGVGHLDFEPSLLPRPEQTLAALRAEHFHLTTHEYPVLHGRSPLRAEAKAKGYLLDAGYADIKPTDPAVVNYKEGQRYLDFSRTEARAWWWEQHRNLVRLGVEGWWLDGGEGPPAETVLHGGTGASLHNRYDVLRQQSFAEGEARDRPEGRPFLLCRSGGVGMQRHGAACWSGDINNTFTTLEAQVPIGLNTGMSGVPLWGTDIGGFYALAPISAELFVRWFQFGAFCPVFRAHGRQWRQHLPWSHGPEIEEICRRFLELRYRLMPYTYTLAWQAHTQGLPLMRPLVLNYPEDARVWELGSEYLWGDDLLVAPVTRAGATQWPVYLPAGRWHDFWTHAVHDGPGGVAVEA